jgi:putative protease
MRSLELLAPAKNLECGLAAIDHGADAVYIGASRFGARVAAGNSVDDIRQLCLYAHQFAAKVYVTVNTIIYDNELEATRQLLAELSDAGVDAILVQDMAVLSLLSDRSPLTSHLSFHASTQTDNRTVEKVRWLRDVGFRRVVLARELSADEIAAIHEAVPDVELEVFVHGALCVSYSGLCYASEHCFGRSANRGACAQFCRMKFDLIDADGRELEHQRHLLSLKDMNLSSHLQELVDAGATSFKIEGRLKDAAYVKNVTAAYSEALNAIIRQHPDRYCRASRGQCTYTFRPDLYKTFNRGFTTYFLHGRQPDIFSPDTPKALGEYVGRVKELRRDSFNVAGTATFANGDGLCFFNADNELEGFRVNRAEGNRLFPQQMPTNLHPGVSLYRNNDQQFERLLSRPSSERRILIRLSLGVTSDGFSLSAEPVGTPAATPVEVTIACEHQQAAKPQHDNIVRQLSKLGGTIYECSGVDLPDSFGYFIPNSTLTDLRRRLVEALNGDGSRCVMAMTQENRPQYVPPHFYDHPYLYNIANRLSCEFYGVDAPTAYELRGGDGPIMQCRHCLRYALGRCRKNPADRSTVEWREPLFLRLGDGRRFRLEFDCKHCQMNVYAED